MIINLLSYPLCVWHRARYVASRTLLSATMWREHSYVAVSVIGMSIISPTHSAYCNQVSQPCHARHVQVQYNTFGCYRLTSFGEQHVDVFLVALNSPCHTTSFLVRGSNLALDTELRLSESNTCTCQLLTVSRLLLLLLLLLFILLRKAKRAMVPNSMEANFKAGERERCFLGKERGSIASC